jgi:glycosyltransferase involved in cell wall biosynthesis
MDRKRYNVLWITSWYPDQNNPVSGIFVREHARAASLFDNVSVFHLMERQTNVRGMWELTCESNEEITAGIPTYHYKPKDFSIPVVSQVVFLLGILRSVRYLIRNGARIDLLHAHTFRSGLSGTFIAKYLKVPMVLTEHSSIFASGRLTKLQKIKAQFAFNSAKVVLPASEFLKKSIQANGISANFVVIGNTFDPEIFFYSAGATKANIIQIITVCNLNPAKKIDLLLQALARLPEVSPDWNLRIVGSGPEEQNLRSLAARLGIQDKVQFSGRLTKGQVADALRQSDFFVLPSLYETFSVATLEALACGLPVLVTKSGGPEEFVTEDFGILIPPDNMHALKDGLLSMLSHAREYNHEEIAQKVKQIYSLEAIGQQIHRVYESILG